jgi:hypothetical protein
MHVPFLEQAIVSFTQGVERGEVVVGVRVGSSSKEVVRRSPPTNEVVNEGVAADVEGLCFRQVERASRRKVGIDPRRKT